MNVTETGTDGSPGTNGILPGQPGTPGGAGGEATAAASSSDSTNTAAATGGAGGAGGSGASGGNGVPGGNAGAGGPGGGASATAITDAPMIAGIHTSAQANGGKGGSAGAPGSGAPTGQTAPSGAGGNAQAHAEAIGIDDLQSKAYAVGGAGGSNAYGGTSGDGGGATASASGISGEGGSDQSVSTAPSLVQVEAGATGGAGGAFGYQQGSAGAGASITMVNAVSGMTYGGHLELTQTATGGAGGDSFGQVAGAGPAGAATSNLEFDDTISAHQSDSVSGTSNAYGGDGGSTHAGADDGGPGSSGGDAAATTNIKGASDARAVANATGGTGGDRADGGAGTATAKGTGYGEVTVLANGYGGDGGSGTVDSYGSGASGGDGSANATGSDAGAHSLIVIAKALGGTGGNGYDGSNANGGAGGGATASANGALDGSGSLHVEADATGGNSGSYSSQASGGNGASVNLVDAVSGSTVGGTLVLAQQASGGLAESSLGSGGSATSKLSFNDATNVSPSASVSGSSTAIGGKGGISPYYGFGSGGNASASLALIGTDVVNSSAVAVGGASSGNAGRAQATASATGLSGLYSAEAHSDPGAASYYPNGATIYVTALDASASGKVDGHGTAEAATQIGNSAYASNTSEQAVATITAQPGSADTSAALAGNARMSAAFGTTQTYVALGELGGGYNSGGTMSESVGTGLDVSFLTATLSTTDHVRLGLYNPTASWDGVGSVSFAVKDNGTTLVSQTFSDAMTAAAYFNDNPLDLGSVGSLSQDGAVALNITLTETLMSAAAALYTDLLLGAAPLCFLRGTMITTPEGEVPVERLRPGDCVLNASGAEKLVLFVGHGRSLVTPANEAARPVIVRKNALSDGVPCRDLKLTRGHGLLVDEVLIPVEFLVNGVSILFDEAAQAVEFFHVEVPGHDVILADGAPAESYKEDGNRLGFQNAAERPCDLQVGADLPWCVPLHTEGAKVEQAWRRILDRSGFVRPETTREPDLHLLADGVRIDPITIEGLTYRFRLDDAGVVLRLVSRSAVPLELGHNHDRRRLGVAVRSVSFAADGLTSVLRHDARCLRDGFHAAEDWGGRWTDGNALLPARIQAAFEGAFEVTVEVGNTTEYSAKAAEPHRAAA